MVNIIHNKFNSIQVTWLSLHPGNLAAAPFQLFTLIRIRVQLLKNTLCGSGSAALGEQVHRSKAFLPRVNQVNQSTVLSMVTVSKCPNCWDKNHRSVFAAVSFYLAKSKFLRWNSRFFGFCFNIDPSYWKVDLAIYGLCKKLCYYLSSWIPVFVNHSCANSTNCLQCLDPHLVLFRSGSGCRLCLLKFLYFLDSEICLK